MNVLFNRDRWIAEAAYKYNANFWWLCVDGAGERESMEREGGKGMARGLTKGNTHTMVALPVMEHQRYVAGSLGR